MEKGVIVPKGQMFAHYISLDEVIAKVSDHAYDICSVVSQEGSGDMAHKLHLFTRNGT